MGLAWLAAGQLVQAHTNMRVPGKRAPHRGPQPLAMPAGGSRTPAMRLFAKGAGRLL